MPENKHILASLQDAHLFCDTFRWSATTGYSLSALRAECSRSLVRLYLGQSEPDQTFEVEVVLYMDRGKRYDIHDIDNRLKDILDALQGRFLGSIAKKLRLIKNDNKICKATIEKRPTPKVFKNKKENAGGRIVIRPYKGSKQ